MEVLTAVSTGDVMATKYGFTPKEPSLANWPSDTQKFVVADEVKEIGKFIVGKFKTDLQNVNIAYLFKKKASKSNEIVTMGQVKTENDMERTLHSYDAVVIIGHDTWAELQLDQKLRLIMHELCHLNLNQDGSKIVNLPHPIEEFDQVVQYFGPGNDAQVAFISAYLKFCRDHGVKLPTV